MTEVIQPLTVTFTQEEGGGEEDGISVNSNGTADNNNLTEYGRDKKSLGDSSVDVFRTCADPGNKGLTPLHSCSMHDVKHPHS